MRVIAEQGHEDALIQLVELPGFGQGFYEAPFPQFEVRLYVRHPRHGTAYQVTGKTFWRRSDAASAYERSREQWCSEECRRWIGRLLRQGTADEDVPYGVPVC